MNGEDEVIKELTSLSRSAMTVDDQSGDTDLRVSNVPLNGMVASFHAMVASGASFLLPLDPAIGFWGVILSGVTMGAFCFAHQDGGGSEYFQRGWFPDTAVHRNLAGDRRYGQIHNNDFWRGIKTAYFTKRNHLWLALSPMRFFRKTIILQYVVESKSEGVTEVYSVRSSLWATELETKRLLSDRAIFNRTVESLEGSERKEDAPAIPEIRLVGGSVLRRIAKVLSEREKQNR